MGKIKTQQGRNHSHEILSEFTDTLRDDVVKEGWSDFWSQLGVDLRGSDSPEANKKSPDQPLVVKDPFTGAIEIFKSAASNSESKKHGEKAPRAEAAMNYHEDFVRSSEHASKQEMREVNQRLQEIMAELQKLVSSSKVLQMEFADIGVEQAPPQAGEYHLNFFDWLLLTIRAARKKVEDSGAWLATGKKKAGGKGKWNNKQRKDYFANTSVSMNNESGGGYINQTG
jgi:hypothetical protein